ncbi:MAG: major capsid protein P2 [Methylococcales bacterium]
MRKLVKLQSIQNVSAGSKATLSLPVGLTYQSIKLLLTNVTLAQIKNIEVIINGKTIQTFIDGLEIDAMNKYESLAASANGFLTLYFARPSMHSLRDQRITAIGTQDVATFSLSFDLDAAVVSPIVEAWATQTDPEPLGLIRKIKRFPLNMGAGLNEIDNLPRGGARIQRIHLKKADIELVTVEIDSVKVFDQTNAVITDTQAEYGLTKQSGYTHLDWTQDGDLSQALATVYPNRKSIQDFRVMATVTAAGNMVAIVEYLDGLGGI